MTRTAVLSVLSGCARFEQRLRDVIHSGAIVLPSGRWKRSQVVPGRRHRTGIGMVEVGSVLLTLSLRPVGAPAARRPSPVAGGPGGSMAGVPAGVSEIFDKSPAAHHAPGGDPVNSQRQAAARGELI